MIASSVGSSIYATTFDNKANASISTTGTATLTVNGTTFNNNGTLTAGGGNITLNSSSTSNLGTLRVLSGGTLTTGTTSLTSAGSAIDLQSGGIFNLGGTFSISDGLSIVTGATVNLKSGMTTAEFSNLKFLGGTAILNSTLTNSGNLTLVGTSGRLQLGTSGVISGGIVATTGGVTLSATGGTLTGVTLATDMTVENGGYLYILNGLTFNNSKRLILNSTGTATYLYVNGTGPQNISGTGSIEFSGTGSNNVVRNTAGTSLVLGSGITVNANSGGNFWNYIDGWTLNGIFNANASASSINTNFTNFTAGVGSTFNIISGTVAVATAGGTPSGATFNIASGATLQFNNSAALTLGSGFIVSGAGNINVVSGTLNINGLADNNLRFGGAGTTNFISPIVVGALDVAGTVAINANVTTSTTSNFTAGSLTLATSKSLTLNGGMNWSSGSTIYGPGNLVIPTGKTLNITGSSYHYVSGATVSNAGTTTLDLIGGYSLYLNSGAVFNSAGSFNFTGASNNYVASDLTGTFNNTGTVQNTGTAIANLGSSNTILNSTGGTFVQSGTGTLNLAGSGVVSFSGTNTFTGSGVFLTAGMHTFADGSVVAGNLNIAGANAVFNNTTANGLVNYSAGGFTLNAGKTLTLNGGMNWTGNTTIGGTGTLVVPLGQTLAISGSAYHNLSGVTVNNAGSTTQDLPGGYSFTFSNSATFNNSGTFSFTGSTTSYMTGSTGGGAFNNTGIVQSTGSGGGSFGGSTLTVTNATSGVIFAQTGTLTVANLAAATNSGELRIAAGATLAYAGNLTNAGTLSGSGTLNMGSNTLTNSTGTISPGTVADPTGTLNIIGNLILGPGGSVQAQLNSTSTGDYDVLAVSGNITYGGTLTLSGTATAGNVLLMTSAGGSSTGTFNNVTSTIAGAMPVYSGTGLTIGISAAGQWTGLGDGFTWSDLNNWGGNQAPTSADDVVIASAGSTLIVNSGSYAVKSLSLGSGRSLSIAGGTFTVGSASTLGAGLSLSSGTLTLNGATTVAGAFNLSGGTLNGTGSLALNGGGTWSGGALDGGISIANAAGQVFNLGGTGTLGFGAVTFNNNGTLNWSGGNVDIVGNGTLNNNAAALLDITSDYVFGDYGVGVGTLTLNNQSGAILRKSAGTGVSSIGGSGGATPNGVNFNNAGSVEVQTGTLSFNHAWVASPLPTGVGTSSGTFAVASGATLKFGGSQTLTSAASVSGLGVVSVANGAFTSSANWTHTGVFMLDGGSAHFTNSIALGSLSAATDTTLTVDTGVQVNGSVAMTGATLNGAGALTLKAISAFNATTLNADVNVANGVNLAVSGGLTFQNGHSINLNPTSALTTLELSGEQTIGGNGHIVFNGTDGNHRIYTNVSNGGSGIILGSGVIVEVNASGRIDGAGASVQVFTNGGTINVAAGKTLNMQTIAVINNSGTINSSGTLAVDPSYLGGGNCCNFSNAGQVNILAGNASILGNGTDTGIYSVATGATLNFQGGGTRSWGGTYKLSGGTIAFTNQSVELLGTLSGVGTFANNGAGTFTNNGTISPGSAADTTGTLNITGNLVMGANSVLNMELNTTTPGDFDLLAVTGNVTYGGVLQLSGAGGTGSYGVVTSASSSGAFASVAGNALASPVYSGSGLLLNISVLLGQWLGTTSNDWSNPLNWSGSVLPGANDDVNIATAGAAISLVSGTYTVKSLTTVAGRTLSISGGSLTVSNASNISSVTLSGGALQLESASTIGSLVLSSGEVRGSGNLAVATLNWAGSLASTGAISVSGGLDIHNGASRTNGAINSNGTATFADSFYYSVPLNDGAVFNNFGTLNLNNNADFSQGTGAASRFVNRAGGVFNRNDHVNGSIFYGLAADNFGTLNLDGAGAIEFRNGGVFSGTINRSGVSPTGAVFLSGGVFDLSGQLGANAALSVISGTAQITGNISLGANASLGRSGTGVLTWTGGNVELASGALLHSNNTNLTIPAGSVLGGVGIVNTGTGTLTNNGTISPGNAADPTGTLNITGNLAMGTGSVLSMDVNSNATGDYDLLAVTGSVSYGGSLQVGGGATAGSFGIITAASSTGTFANVTGTANSVGVNTGTGLTLNIAVLLGQWLGTTNNDWGVASNWSGGVIPTSNDDVNLAGAGSIITLTTGNFTVKSLTTSVGSSLQLNGGGLTVTGGSSVAGGLSIAAGTHTFGGASVFNGTTQLSGGDLIANGNLDIQNSFTWTGGTISGTGVLTTSGTSSVSAGSLNAKVWNNTGNLLKVGAGVFDVANGTASVFNNSGTVSVNAGEFKLGTATGSDTGTYTVANLATLRFSSDHNFASTSSFNGPGNVIFNGGTQFMASGVQINAAATLDASTLSLQDVALNSTLTYAGGSMTIESGKALTVNSAGVLHISAGKTLSLFGGELAINGGALTGGDSTSQLSFDGTLRNVGALNLNSLVPLLGSGTLVNDGTLTGTNYTLPVALTNSATGTLNLTGGGVSGNFNNYGNFNVGGVVLLSGAIADQLGGKITIPSGTTLQRNTGALRWVDGTLSGTGAVDATGGSFVFSGTGNRVIDGLNFTFDNLTLPNGSLTVQSGSLTLTGTATLPAGVALNLNGGTFTNNAALTIAGAFNLVGGTFDGSGGLNMTGGSLNLPSTNAIVWNNSGALNNTGTLNFANGTITNAITNNGTINVGSGVTFNQVFVNNGALVLGVGSGTTTFVGGLLINNGGTLSGSGTVGGNVTVTNGTLAPGYSPGAITVAGNLNLTSSSVLTVELGGLTQGSGYDFINVQGTATLAGTLNVTSYNGFVAPASSSYTFMNFAGATGSFATVNLPSGWNLSYQTALTNLSVTAPAAAVPVVTPVTLAALVVAPSLTPEAVALTLERADTAATPLQVFSAPEQKLVSVEKPIAEEACQ